ncbi:hypothetical protein [Chamaesiphon sp.]|uniref:hypothetical protein n=1 Tax=Chamaesiphon sp. TaxID=2814140 RepID=UPI003592F64B
MNNTNPTPAATPPADVAAPETAQTFSESLSVMKADNKSEAQRIVAPETKGKPQTLADACLAMKDENLAEAQRLVPDRNATKNPQ